MRYAKLEILSDMPMRKIICIRMESNPLDEVNSKVTQLYNVPTDDVAKTSRGLVTVVVKGANLPYSVIQQIVRDYLTGTLTFYQDARFQIIEN
jgi:hypothetical protein